jgi:hypothetical protein
MVAVHVQEVDRTVVETSQRMGETTANEVLIRILICELRLEPLEGRWGPKRIPVVYPGVDPNALSFEIETVSA